jgi:SNF2 family DNA or RNA helicase
MNDELKPNLYPGKCRECGGDVKAQAGYREHVNGSWTVFHKDGECIGMDGLTVEPMADAFDKIVADLDWDIAPDALDDSALPDKPAELTDPIFDHPVVKELQAKLAELMGSIDKAEQDFIKSEEKIVKAMAKKKDFLDSIAEQTKAFDEAIWDAQAHKRKVAQKMNELEHAKNMALQSIESTVQAQQAMVDLDAAREVWQQIIEDHNWLWADRAWDFQTLCIEFVASAIDRDLGGCAILDQMGLGKTLEAQGSVDLIRAHPKYDDIIAERTTTIERGSPSSQATLWVTPSTIKTSTRKELAKWSDKPAVALEGTPAERAHIVRWAHQMGMTLIVGYEQLRDRLNKPVTPELFDYEWPIIVMDEIHRAKNRDTSTFFNMKQLVKKSAFCIPMTGTPIMNRADEFWTILHFLTQKGKRAGEFEKFSDFERIYLSGYYAQSNAFAPGAFDQLIGTVKDMVIRRRKDEVLKDMPDKIREVRFVQMDGKQRELYDQMRDKLYVWLDEQKSDAISATNFLAQLTRLRQIALFPAGVKMAHTDPETGTETEVVLDCTESAKIDEAMELIVSLMEADEKVLIFSNYNGALLEIEKRIADMGLTWDDGKRQVRSGAIIGGVKDSIRSELQDRFNEADDDLRVVVGNIRAMGVGLNLQGACSHAIFLDLDWTPGGNEQAEDRLHRGGQENNVTIHIIQAESSVDAYIADKLEQKQGLIDGMIERDELRRALDEGMI